MRYQIYQIADFRNCIYAFVGWNEAKDDFNIKDYKFVYSGTLNDEYKNADISALNYLFEVFNIKHPKDFSGHSLSVSDIIILISDKGEQNIYYCDSFGWKDITGVSFPHRMSYDEMVEYLLDELNKERIKKSMNKENRYDYIFMLCNDMGIIEGQ